MALSATQFAIEGLLVLACLVGYRAKNAHHTCPKPLDPSIAKLTVRGEGEWVVLGISEGTLFQSTEPPEIVSSGFELDGDRGPVAAPPGLKVQIRAFEGARREPLKAPATAAASMRPRLTFEVRSGTVLYTEANLPLLDPYRASPMVGDATVVLSGDPCAVTVAKEFAHVWLLIFLTSVLGAAYWTFMDVTWCAWICIAAAGVQIYGAFFALRRAGHWRSR